MKNPVKTAADLPVAQKLQNARRAAAAVATANGRTFPATLKVLSLLEDCRPKTASADEAMAAEPLVKEIREIAEKLKEPILVMLTNKSTEKGWGTFRQVDDFIRALDGPGWQGH